MDTECWNAIATLGSLDELSFDRCEFLERPADVGPEAMVKVKVSRLRVVDCIGVCQPTVAIDARYLVMDDMLENRFDWLSRCSILRA